MCVCVPMKGEENYQILPEFWARLHLPTKYLDKLTNSSDKHFQLKVHLGNSFIFSPRNVLFFSQIFVMTDLLFSLGDKGLNFRHNYCYCEVL